MARCFGWRTVCEKACAKTETARRMGRANGLRERAPDHRLRETNHSTAREMVGFAALYPPYVLHYFSGRDDLRRAIARIGRLHRLAQHRHLGKAHRLELLA